MDLKKSENLPIQYLNIDKTKVLEFSTWLVIIIGIFLRLAQYLSDRSLWFDEALISLNITSKSFPELLNPLDYNQVAPVGFLFTEKFLVKVFGLAEYILRIFPLFCGIVSLFIFNKLVRYYFSPAGVLIAVALFAITDPLIYYSAEVKSYSCDVTVTLLFLLIATIIDKAEKISPLQVVLLGIFGALLPWFSISSIFVLGGVVVSLLLKYIANKNWEKVKNILFCSLFWTLGFLLMYKIHLLKLILDKGKFFPGNYPTPITFNYHPVDGSIFIRFFEYLQLYKFGIPQILFFVGLVSMFKRSKIIFFISALTILFMIFASFINCYTSENRLMLFTVPIIIIFIAEGILLILKKLSVDFSIITTIIICLLFWHPVSIAINNLINPRTVHEIKPVLSYIKEHSRKDDILYVYPNAQYAFKFYAKQFGFNDDFEADKSIYSPDQGLNRWIEKQGYTTIALGINDSSKFLDNLNALRGHKRVWILLSQVLKKEHEVFIVNHLDNIGIRLLHFSRIGAKVYLYDLSNREKQI